MAVRGHADAVEDVREECQKYGPVVSLLVPKESPGRGQVSGARSSLRRFSSVGNGDRNGVEVMKFSLKYYSAFEPL